MAVTAQIAAYAYLLTGVFAWWWQGEIAFASVAIYGLSRAIAAWGLLRLKRYGSILEQVSAIVWLLFCVGGWRQFGVIRPLLLPGVLVSIAQHVFAQAPFERALIGEELDVTSELRRPGPLPEDPRGILDVRDGELTLEEREARTPPTADDVALDL